MTEVFSQFQMPMTFHQLDYHQLYPDSVKTQHSAASECIQNINAQQIITQSHSFSHSFQIFL